MADDGTCADVRAAVATMARGAGVSRARTAEIIETTARGSGATEDQIARAKRCLPSSRRDLHPDRLVPTALGPQQSIHRLGSGCRRFAARARLADSVTAPDGIRYLPQRNNHNGKPRRKGYREGNPGERLERSKAEAYYVFPGTTLTVCALTLRNGFQVVGESAAASPENFK